MDGTELKCSASIDAMNMGKKNPFTSNNFWDKKFWVGIIFTRKRFLVLSWLVSLKKPD